MVKQEAMKPRRGVIPHPKFRRRISHYERSVAKPQPNHSIRLQEDAEGAEVF
jgi:hypothetical protein